MAGLRTEGREMQGTDQLAVFKFPVAQVGIRMRAGAVHGADVTLVIADGNTLPVHVHAKHGSRHDVGEHCDTLEITPLFTSHVSRVAAPCD